MAYLLVSRQINFDPEGKIFIGELALDGSIRPVFGVMPIAIMARTFGTKELYVPEENAKEAGLVDGIDIFPLKT